MVELCVVTKAWRSGAAWHSQLMVQAMAEAGATIALIAPLAEPLEREPNHANVVRRVIVRERVDGATRWPCAMASLARIMQSVWATLAMRGRTKTFLFTIPEPLPVTLVLWVILRLSGARIIYLVHDSQPHAWRLQPQWRWLERGLHALSYRLATDLTCLTQSVADDLVGDFGSSPRKITVIPHGAFTIGALAPLSGQGRLLVFGSLRANKCVLEVIESVLLARKNGLALTLVLAGEPLVEEQGYWQQCLEAMKADPAAFEVHARFIADTELPGLVGSVDAFVLAYRDFSSQSGVAVLAALAGRPVIATGEGGLVELFAQGLSGVKLASPVNVHSVAEALEQFAATPIPQWQFRALEAQKYFVHALSWDKIGKRYLALAKRFPS